MDDLTWTLKQLCRRNRDGSLTTQADRRRSLTLVARQLKEAGFRQMKATSLKGKHVQALLDRWQAEGLSAGTLKNRMAHLRWWAEKIGKGGIIAADNSQLGIPDRRFVTNVSKAQVLDHRLDAVTDPYVRMSLELQAAFGLRRQECIKFSPSYADRGDRLMLKSSWTKGGKDREVPILTASQREVLNRAHQMVGNNSLIPTEKRYIQQQHVYDGQCKAAGLSKMHGLRHRYAQMRYEMLTGWKAPAAGGPVSDVLTPEQEERDAQARQQISEELGHKRLQITVTYLGR
ncbi:integrase-like protein [Kerstersia gyiorum]|uniref:Integrase-like protein n=1 Tax=Kerstersia gyiorum TaxID=206506 RepID=A0A4Q7MME8_9BURK|nr:phage integrase N-terminal domain-containing protein [Kerstersia gyiorum]KAB0544673.1 integrase [Kerstersia gyiorum]RZS69554.1 integrase-like protein [Kerstersia gyiorum]